jgi:hypothetical protein
LKPEAERRWQLDLFDSFSRRFILLTVEIRPDQFQARLLPAMDEFSQCFKDPTVASVFF